MSTPAAPTKSTSAMISSITPTLFPETYIFCTTKGSQPSDSLLASALSIFREDEGLSLILPLEVARNHGFDVSQPMRRITLKVWSALDGVGLTAAVATALTEVGVPCNVVAGFYHDHLFVPGGMEGVAVGCLRGVQERAREGKEMMAEGRKGYS